MIGAEFLTPVVCAAIVIGCVVNCVHVLVREGTGFYQDFCEIVATIFVAVILVLEVIQ